MGLVSAMYEVNHKKCIFCVFHFCPLLKLSYNLFCFWFRWWWYLMWFNVNLKLHCIFKSMKIHRQIIYELKNKDERWKRLNDGKKQKWQQVHTHTCQLKCNLIKWTGTIKWDCDVCFFLSFVLSLNAPEMRWLVAARQKCLIIK